jgi:hypothetical protein
MVPLLQFLVGSDGVFQGRCSSGSSRLSRVTLVDGELVAFDADGRPHLRRLLRRHGLANLWQILRPLFLPRRK